MLRKTLAVTLAAAVCLGNAQAADDTIRTHAITDSLFVLFGSGGNIAVLTGKDGTYLVDDQYAPMTPHIRKALKALSDAPVRFVFNTHWHTDHTGGNANFARTGSLLVAHENVRTRLSSDQFISAFQREVPAADPSAWPVLTFDQRISFHLNNETVHSLHVARAHTDGDSLVHFEKANALHMGDTFFNGIYPFIDLSSGGSIDGVLAALQTALTLSDARTVIIPGHGPITDRAGLKRYQQMLQSLRDQVAAQLDQGQSIEQVVASRPTRAYDDELGGGFITPQAFARTLAESLSHSRADQSE